LVYLLLIIGFSFLSVIEEIVLKALFLKMKQLFILGSGTFNYQIYSWKNDFLMISNYSFDVHFCIANIVLKHMH